MTLFFYDNIYEKNSKFFHKFLTFFSFFGHLTKKRFLCTVGQKKYFLYILGGLHVHLTLPKCSFY